VFIANPKHLLTSSCPKEGVNQQLHSTMRYYGITAQPEETIQFLKLAMQYVGNVEMPAK
jgi:hypothetical protein